MHFHTLALQVLLTWSCCQTGAGAFVPTKLTHHKITASLHQSNPPIRHANTILFSSNDDENENKSANENKPKIPKGLPPDAGKALDGVDAVEAEARKAIEAANEALRGASVNVDSVVSDEEKQAAAERQRQIDLQRKMEKEKAEARKKVVEQIQKDAVVSAIGGVAYGFIGGIAADIAIAANDIDLDMVIPPIALGAGIGVAGLALGLQENEVGSTARSIFGGPVKSITKSITSAISSAIESAVDEVKATPSKIKNVVDQKVKETTDEIKAIPQKVKDKAVETVNKTTDEIKAIPEKVKDETVKAVEKTKEEIEKSTKKAVEEIKATPGRVVEGTKKKVIEIEKDLERQVEETIEQIEKKVEETVDEIVSFPGKKIDELSETVSKVLPMEKKTPPSIPVPKPPEMPPPSSMLKETKISDEVRKPSVPQPSVPLDKVISKVEIPKIEMPKVEIPKIPEIPKVQIPMPPVPPKTKPDIPQVSIPKQQEPPKPKKQKPEDNFVFSEVSLKSFVNNVIAEDKEDVVESDKSEQEKKMKEEAERRQKQKEEDARQRKQIAEQRKLAAEAREKQKQDEKEERKQLIESKRAQAAVDAAKPRSTISLGFLNLLGSSSDDSTSSTSTSSAPDGIPTLSKWKQNPDGSVTGLISGSKAFRNNESVTTSPIKTKSLSPDSVVVTVSGSKYFLGEKALGSLLFGGKSPAPSSSSDDQAEIRRKEAEEKRAASIAAAEEKRAAAIAAAEERKRIAEEKRAAAIADAEERKRIAEEKRAAAIAAAEERKREVEEKKRAAKQQAEVKLSKTLSIREEQAKKADDAVSGAKKGATISLGFLGFGSQNDEYEKTSEAPRGIPTINKWRKNRDGSVTGFISGSKAFEDGESITTSPLTSDPSEGMTVSTISGSKYFLKSKSGGLSFFGGGVSKSVSPEEKKDTKAAQRSPLEEQKAAQIAAAQARQLENEKRKAAQKAAAEERKAAAEAAKRAKSEEVARKKAESAKRAEVKQTVKTEEILTNAKPRATISLDLFSFAKSSEDESSVATAPKPQPKIVSQAPRGVPTFSNWKSNRDGSITGSISGSNAYDDGKVVTTSPLTTAAVEGALVQTTSGSRYFLAPKGSKQGSQQAAAAEERKAAQQAAAEERKAAQQAAAEAKRIAAEERKAAQQAAAEAKRIAAEERKAAQQAAVEAKRIAAEERKAAQQAAVEAANRAKSEEAAKKKAEAADASRVQRSKSQSQEALSKAASGSTISLGFLNFGLSSDESTSTSPNTTSSQRKITILSKAPNGVPTLSKWRQNRDGSITGLISGSNAFTEGESITTSPIVTGVADGALVQTSSGSRYFLAPKNVAAAPKVSVKPAAPVQQKRVPPPRGVPKLINWRKNRDDSITGFISGSPNFDEGEKITTSPITSGSIEEGQVVRTGSGSSYYLV